MDFLSFDGSRRLSPLNRPGGFLFRAALVMAFSALGLVGSIPLMAAPVIHEILFHPQDPEDTAEEFIELFLAGPEPVALDGWELRGGVDYVFPAGTLLEPGGYLVVAASPEVLRAEHPGVQVLGPWRGRLGNDGETLRLLDGEGREVDAVSYADEGDWAVRERGPEDRGHQGWVWSDATDGAGSSLELIQPGLDNAWGLNWEASHGVGGTPGRSNSVARVNVAPIIHDLRHEPLVPRETDPVTVRVRVEDETTPSMTLLWRRGSGAWEEVPMQLEEGDGGGRYAGEGAGLAYSAVVPPLPDRAVVQFYVRASDGEAERNYPTPEAPCLYQVEAEGIAFSPWDPGARPLYRLIMTEAEREALARIGTTPEEAESNAQMNATFISRDGTGWRVRYQVGVRNRGASSRLGPPNNYLVQFRSDALWQGREAVKLNVRQPTSQALGAVLFRRAGIPAAEALEVYVRVNGQRPAGSVFSADDGGVGGVFAQVEVFGGRFAERQFPGDDQGNLYQVRDDELTGEQGDLRYRGEEASAYRTTYFKQTNALEDDWSDLMEFTRRLNDPELTGSAYVSALEEVMDIDGWLRALAVDSLLGNREGGLTTGKGDDFALYRGEKDPRFQLVMHDLDTLLGQGRTPDPTRSIWTYVLLGGLEKFFSEPEIERRYLATHRELLETFYREDLLFPLVDRVVGAGLEIVGAAMKSFITSRRAAVRMQVEAELSVETELSQREGLWWTDEETVALRGRFAGAVTESLWINGREGAALGWKTGTWRAEGVPLDPGLNTVLVEAYGGSEGGRSLMESVTIRIWREAPEGTGLTVGGVVVPQTGWGDPAQLRLRVRSGYVPGVPFLVRAELVDEAGEYRRDVWDRVIKLRTDREDVVLEPSSVRLFNGVGSALVRVRGTGGAADRVLVAEGSVWHYLDDGTDQGVRWRAADFDDSAWPSGRGELGYGDGDEVTVVGFGGDASAKFATTYFRHRFEVDDLADVGTLTLRLKADDAAAVYLNGVEAARTANLAPDAAYDDYASSDVADENGFAVFDVPVSLLREGGNVLAIEVHQGDGRSSDISMEAALLASAAVSDPGDFTVIGENPEAGVVTEDHEVRRSMTSWADRPVTTVTGTLSGEATRWGGVVRVTGDVVVPAGHVLTVGAGTLVLLEGRPEPLSEDGSDLVVRGELRVEGTFEDPVSFTASDFRAPWGEIRHENSAPSGYRHVEITRGGHAPRGGHTNTGPVMRIEGSEITLEESVISDVAGKVMQVRDSQLWLERNHFARAAMGPETNRTGVWLRDCTITEMLGEHREDGVTDDNDGMYLHAAGTGKVLDLQGLCVARVDDDGLDTLNARSVVRESILRDCADKGASINGGAAELERMLAVRCAYGVQAKGAGGVVTLRHVTMSDVGVGLLMADGADDVRVENSILDARDAVVMGGEPEVRYTLASTLMVGEGNLAGEPQFVSLGRHDYRLLPGSPARDAGDPQSSPDPDGSRADMGRFPAVDDEGLPDEGDGVVVWRVEDSPVRVISDLRVPQGVMLVIEPGCSVYPAPGVTLTIEGNLRAVGTPGRRIYIGTDPSLPPVADLHPLLPMSAPKWGGIQFVDSLSEENVIAYADIGHAQNDLGSVGIVRSQVMIDHCRFYGTHFRMVYADSSSVTVQYSVFPDMFAEGEQPDALGLDNVSEHIKAIGAYPAGGHFIIRHNQFGRNKGHNDNIDVDSGLRPGPILQVLHNHFLGAGDELLDLGGDVYVAGNVFTNVFKDDETSDRGYANAISTGDAANRATIVATRNLFWNVDHAINLKRNVATIFEYNTVYQVHDDFHDRFGNENVGSVVNLFVEEPGATPGLGAYLRGNLLYALPRVFGNVDLPADQRSALGMAFNWIDPGIKDRSVGFRALLVDGLGSGNVYRAAPFVDADGGNFSLAAHAGALGAGPLGEDLGMTAEPGIWIAGEPAGGVTESRTVTLHLGGPGLFAYRYRVNDGEWSDELPIGTGFAGEATERTASLTLTDLQPGVTYRVEAVGQDFAGNWQTESEATVSRSWSVQERGVVLLNEVLAVNRNSYLEDGRFPDYVELWNPGAATVSLEGWRLSDREDAGSGAVLRGMTVEPGGLLVLTETALGFGFDGEKGETLFLRDAEGALVDALTFGRQAPDVALGRAGVAGRWTVVETSPGWLNTRRELADPAKLKLTEWSGAPGIRLERDFVEIYNGAAAPVEISGWTLGDVYRGAMAWPPLSFVGPGEYLVNTDLGIDGLRDYLFFRDAEGNLRDFVVTAPQNTGRSEMRLGSWGEIPTPGMAEIADENVKQRFLALFEGLRVTEIMFHPDGDGAAEFIELENVGAVPLELEGVRFTEGIGFQFPSWRLLPGEQVVLAADEGAFRRRYGEAAPLDGVYEGRLSNGGETLVLTLPAPYEAAILRIRYDDAGGPEADGGGYSLVFAGEKTSSPEEWDRPGGWREGEYPGGTPGGHLPEPPPASGYEAWAASWEVGLPAEDADGDGITHLEEYAYDLNPRQADKLAGSDRLGVRMREGVLEVSAALVSRPDLEVTLEGSRDLQRWEILPVAMPSAGVPVAVEGWLADGQVGYLRVRLRLVGDLE